MALSIVKKLARDVRVGDVLYDAGLDLPHEALGPKMHRDGDRIVMHYSVVKEVQYADSLTPEVHDPYWGEIRAKMNAAGIQHSLPAPETDTRLFHAVTMWVAGWENGDELDQQPAVIKLPHYAPIEVLEGDISELGTPEEVNND
jgi:hypothetical protein